MENYTMTKEELKHNILYIRTLNTSALQKLWKLFTWEQIKKSKLIEIVATIENDDLFNALNLYAFENEEGHKARINQKKLNNIRIYLSNQIKREQKNPSKLFKLYSISLTIEELENLYEILRWAIYNYKIANNEINTIEVN